MSHTGVIRKGPTPIWFNEFNNPNNMLGKYGPIPNQLATFWYIRPSQLIVKIHKRLQPIRCNEILIGKHYLLMSNDNLTKCKGCSKGRNHDSSCIIQFPSTIATSLWVSSINSLTFKYRLNNLIDEIINVPLIDSQFQAVINIEYITSTPSLKNEFH